MTAQHLSPDIANQKVEEFLADIHADPESDITFDQFCQLAAGMIAHIMGYQGLRAHGLTHYPHTQAHLLSCRWPLMWLVCKLG